MRVMFLIRKVPVIGTVLWLANAYAYGGDQRSKDHFAPVRLWIKAFFWNVSVAVSLTVGTLHEFSMSVFDACFYGGKILQALPSFGGTVGSTIISVFPNLLGLGIGIYALLFALDSTVIRTMHQRIEDGRRSGVRSHGSVLILNADIAFPLCVLLSVVVLGIFAQFFANYVWVQVICWIAFWYGLIVILEIIALLFLLIDNSLLEKAAAPSQTIAAGLPSPVGGATAPLSTGAAAAPSRTVAAAPPSSTDAAGSPSRTVAAAPPSSTDAAGTPSPATPAAPPSTGGPDAPAIGGHQ